VHEEDKAAAARSQFHAAAQTNIPSQQHSCKHSNHSSVRNRVPGENKFVFLGPERACRPTEVSSMNRHSDDLLANYGRKYFFGGY
jgi:hypothetical protein